MEKPIIATTLSGLFIKSEPWEKAHILWYEKIAKKLGDDSIKEWVEKKDYFKGVDIAMKKLYPNLSEEQRTTKARETFFDSVIEYIKQNPKTKNKKTIKYFESLKDKYELALITTNTSSAIKKILNITGLKNLFDIIETSKPEEKDDKKIVFKRFVEKYKKPVIYIGGSKKDSFDYCKENNIKHIFVNFKNKEVIDNTETIYNLEELKQKISKL